MSPFLATSLTILVSGVAAIAVLMAAQLAGFGGVLAAPYAFAAVLVFGVGLAFAGYLWWLSARSFALLQNPATTPEQLAALRDLPMALPEGTVRAVLALIVGVIGLPLLLFSQALALNDAVAGYVNGIIAGVFGYYFGTRSNGGDAQTSRRIGEALSREQQVSEALRQSEAQAREAAAQAGAPERLWTRYPGFADPAEAAAGLAEFRRALLAERVAADVTPAVLARLPDTLRGARPVLPQPGPPEAQAALQALVLLLGELRERHIDPLPLVAEVAP